MDTASKAKALSGAFMAVTVLMLLLVAYGRYRRRARLLAAHRDGPTPTA